MPDAVAARRLARRSRDGGRHAAFARRWGAFALTGAALLGVCSAFHLSAGPVGLAHAAGAAANTPAQAGRPAMPVPSLPAPPRTTLPGFNPPPATPGTTASGPVRAQPARMPFYVATRGTTTIYVLGTLHVGDPADYPPGQPFRAPILGALAASPTLALELSPDELLVSQDDVSKYGVCRGDCLPGLLPEPLWRKLASRLRGNPAAQDEIKKMRPWLASLVVETYDSLSAGLQTEYGTEAQLQNVYIRTRGKIVGLETLPQQMRAFTGLIPCAATRNARAGPGADARGKRRRCEDVASAVAEWAMPMRLPRGKPPKPKSWRATSGFPIRSTTGSCTSATGASYRGCC